MTAVTGPEPGLRAEPPDEPCVNPACERSVYFPDKPSFWAVAWIPDRMWEQPLPQRACSLRCLALAIAAQAGGSVEIRWAGPAEGGHT